MPTRKLTWSMLPALAALPCTALLLAWPDTPLWLLELLMLLMCLWLAVVLDGLRASYRHTAASA